MAYFSCYAAGTEVRFLKKLSLFPPRQWSSMTYSGGGTLKDFSKEIIPNICFAMVYFSHSNVGIFVISRVKLLNSLFCYGHCTCSNEGTFRGFSREIVSYALVTIGRFTYSNLGTFVISQVKLLNSLFCYGHCTCSNGGTFRGFSREIISYALVTIGRFTYSNGGTELILDWIFRKNR